MKFFLRLMLPFFFLVNTFFAYSQVSIGGQPLSFAFGDKSTKDNVPQHVMASFDIEALRAEDAILDQHKDIPWRFGHNIEVSIDVKQQGVEEQIAGGTLWRTAIVSPDAISINLLFDNFQIPHGATLFIYNNEKTDVIGAFTDFNNREDLVFATIPLRGEHIILEYFEPNNAHFSGVLHISQVTHGYRGPHEFVKGFGGSGSCNVNVACPQSAGMEDQIRSSAMLVTGSSGFCSGALINNTNNDGKAYFLSADHCFSNPSSVIYWFNWQSAACANPPSSPSYNSVSGATTRARYATSDMWLVELSSVPPSSYNVYYSGWNRTMDNNITGKIWGIHHPAGDIKKISWSTQGASTTTYLENPVPGNGSHWRVTQWSDGTTTEGGSSGSPLYDPQGRIIGQLHGGYASCSSMTSDWYGKLGVSWTGGGADASRLSNWLDPTGSGSLTVEGYDPNTPSVALDMQLLNVVAPLTSYCSLETITPQVEIKNRGTQTVTSATVSYVMNGGSPVTVNWTGSLTTGQIAVVSFSPIYLSAGTSQTFVATVTNPNGSADENPSNDQYSLSFNAFTDFISPFSEGFEGAVFPPNCWTQEYVTGSTNWTKSNGGNGNPSSAYAGTGNALLYLGSFTSSTSKLITPPLKIAALNDAVLTFWHAQVAWSGDQDELRVYYKTSATGAWQLLQTYTTAATTWTQRTIALPAVSNEYYIAFEGKTNYGYGVCVDDVLVSGSNAGTEEYHNSKMYVYPNPSDGIVNVVFAEKMNQAGVLRVTDVNGAIVYEEFRKEGVESFSLDLGFLSGGIYFIHFNTESNNFVKKVILQ